jgi:hypothetical protein
MIGKVLTEAVCGIVSLAWESADVSSVYSRTSGWREMEKVRILVVQRGMLRRRITFQVIVSLYLLNPLQKKPVEEESNYGIGTHRLLLLARVKQTTSSTSLVARPIHSL